MTEAQVQEQIAEHNRRNRELRSALLAKGVSLSEKRPTDFFFWSTGQHDAAAIARELYRKGFLVKFIAPEAPGSETWRITAGALVTAEQALGSDLTEKLVRLASDCDGVFDGWSTEV